ncbi:hypothetical protein MRB53_031747 [Persea americana]|uniref:Uncharacterized protein n=1 Tax=Persea americana TaxID=3435 RepID=A0ACC2KQH2_PERAE|nr:hypothetical protein MRB53_031747 [Persea americana]
MAANRNGDDVTEMNRIYLVGFFPNDLSQITSSWRLDIWSLVIRLCWFLLHQVFNTVHVMTAVVVDSEEALQTLRIIKLLQWLSAIGVKHVSLYDMEGVLKKNKETILKSLSNSRLWEESHEKATFLNGGKMTLEFLSVSDGREGIAKAASYLCSKYMKAKTLSGNQNERVFTESDVDIALQAVVEGRNPIFF